MVARFTHQGCKVETIYVIQPNGTFSTEITLSVDPASALSLVIEEHASRAVVPRDELPRGSSRVRSTRHGFELVPERR
jgi:hypothetical protein